MHRHVVGLVLLVIAQGACGGSPAPTAPASASAAPSVVAVFVQAPPGVSANDQVVGQETQLSASVRFADGRVKSGATTQVSWASSTLSVAAVSPSGVMRIVSAGEADVSATFEGVSGRAHVYAWPGDRVELRGTIRSSSGAPIAGARVTTTSDFRFPRAETASDADGRFHLAGIDQPTAFGDIVAIHDDYDVASVPFRPDQLARGIDVVLQPSPDRVYVRVRGSNMCAEHPFDVLHVGGLTVGGRRLATFTVRHAGMFHLVGGVNDSPLSIGAGGFLYRLTASGEPIVYFNAQPLDAGFTYNWVEFGDIEYCPQEYDMTLFHPR